VHKTTILKRMMAVCQRSGFGKQPAMYSIAGRGLGVRPQLEA